MTLIVPQPLVFGRKLPFLDFEGDDHTPGAGGSFVTCGDSCLNVAAAWATNGRSVRDGSVYRASDPAPAGVTYDHLAIELKRVAHLNLVQPTGWTWGNCSWHLTHGNGLIFMGKYSLIPASLRFQAAADFMHFMWAPYYSTTSGIRLYDPLNPNTRAFGKWVPAATVRAFIESGNMYVAYVANQPL